MAATLPQLAFARFASRALKPLLDIAHSNDRTWFERDMAASQVVMAFDHVADCVRSGDFSAQLVNQWARANPLVLRPGGIDVIGPLIDAFGAGIRPHGTSEKALPKIAPAIPEVDEPPQLDRGSRVVPNRITRLYEELLVDPILFQLGAHANFSEEQVWSSVATRAFASLQELGDNASDFLYQGDPLESVLEPYWFLVGGLRFDELRESMIQALTGANSERIARIDRLAYAAENSDDWRHRPYAGDDEERLTIQESDDLDLMRLTASDVPPKFMSPPPGGGPPQWETVFEDRFSYASDTRNDLAGKLFTALLFPVAGTPSAVSRQPQILVAAVGIATFLRLQSYREVGLSPTAYAPPGDARDRTNPSSR